MKQYDLLHVAIPLLALALLLIASAGVLLLKIQSILTQTALVTP